MTWTLRERGDTGGTVRLEYRCPVHGRFEMDVSRAASPDAVLCTVECGASACGPLCDDLELGPDHVHLAGECGAISPWSPSGVLGRVKQGEVVQGKADERPADKHVMDTRALADGMPLAEFKARRAKVHRDIALERIRKMTR